MKRALQYASDRNAENTVFAFFEWRFQFISYSQLHRVWLSEENELDTMSFRELHPVFHAFLELIFWVKL